MSNRMDNPNRSPSPDDRSSRSTTADSDSSSPPQVFQDAHRKSIYDPVPVFPAAQKVETFEKPYISASGGGSGTVSGSGSGSGLGNGSGNGSKSGNSKKPAPKRRKVSQACVYCRRSHMTCDEGRPCQRCIKRKIAHLCHDESKGPSGPGGQQASSGHALDMGGGYDGDGTDIGVGPSTAATAASEMVAAAAAAVASGATLTPAVVAAVANALPSLSGTMMNPTTAAAAAAAVAANNTVASLSNPRGPDGGAGYTFPALSSFPPLFASEHMGNEFNILTDFLASLDETHAGRSIRGFGGHAALTLREVVSGDSHEKPSMGGTAHGLGMTDPTAQLSSTEKFVLTAADPGDGTYDDRLNQVITAKFEAGLLKPYNYVNSYTRLQRWMETHMSPGSRARILNVMGIFRPKFRWIAQSLTDIDLVLVEEAFERLLLEYDRVFSSMGIPSCLWRRTGEICKCNKEFASLVGLPMEKLRDGRVHIYELMSEESAVNYWEKYGNIAFDAGQKAVLTSCVLKGLDGSRNVNCCFSFTIRRDRYNIPLMIAGNFLLAADDP